MSIQIEISVGEFLDKLTILQIKQARIKDPTKLKHINTELKTLITFWENSNYKQLNLDDQITALKAINEELWDIEDEIRLFEQYNRFDDAFVVLARAVYIKNDKRAAIKKIINVASKSKLIEEKSY